MAVPEGYSPLGRLGYVDRGTYAASTKYMKGDVVYYNGSTYTALKDNLTGVTPVNGSNWKYMARGFSADNLSNVQAKDTSGVIGTAGATVVSQDLIDAIADKVMTKLLAKTDIVQTESTATNKVPSSAYVKQMFDTANSNLVIEEKVGSETILSLIQAMQTNTTHKYYINQKSDAPTFTSSRALLTIEKYATAIYLTLEPSERNEVYRAFIWSSSGGLTSQSWVKAITNADLPILTVRTGTRYWTQYTEVSGQRRIYFYNADFPSGDNLLGYIALTK